MRDEGLRIKDEGLRMRDKMDNKLKIIDECISLVKECYKVTNKLPISETYGLKNQMNRCVVSVGSNIVEGNSRETPKDYLRFIVIARGSLYELEFQNKVIKELYNIEIDNNQIIKVKSMITGLYNYVKSLIPHP